MKKLKLKVTVVKTLTPVQTTTVAGGWSGTSTTFTSF